MLQTATAYTDVRRAALSGGGTPAIRVRRSRRVDRHRAWLQREMREGGYFDRYVAQEKARLNSQIRAVARGYHNARPKSWRDLPKAAREIEAEMTMAIPGRLYWRLLQEDEHYFDDPKNLRKLKADNPELCIWT